MTNAYKKNFSILSDFLNQHANQDISFKELMDGTGLAKNTLLKYLKDFKNLHDKELSIENTDNNKKIYRFTPFSEDNTTSPQEDIFMSIDYIQYLILFFLQQGPQKKEEIIRKFVRPEFQSKTIETEDLDQSWNIPKSEESLLTILNGLVLDNLIEVKDDIYYYVAKNLPVNVLLPSDINDVYNILYSMSSYYSFPGNMFYSQVRSISQKLDLIYPLYEDKDEAEEKNSSSLFLLFGKNFLNTEEIQAQLSILLPYSFDRYAISFDYTPKNKPTTQITFKVGLLLYSYEKNGIFLLGRMPNSSKIYIYRLDRIKNPKITDVPNTDFRSEEYLSLLSKMFAPEIDNPEGYDVCIRFENLFNIESKILNLKQGRKNAQITYDEKTGSIYYTDKVIGLTSFAAYLRRFGRVCHVEGPVELREKMAYTANRSLERYGVSTNES